MSDAKTWKEMRRKLREQGCHIEQQKNTHHKVFDAQGNIVTVIQNGKASWRTVANKRKELSRKGFTV